MRLPENVKAAAALCSDRRVKVTTVTGETYTLSLHSDDPVPDPKPVEPPPDEASKELLQRDLETRAMVASVLTRMDNTVQALQESVSRVAANQDRMVQEMKSVVEVLSAPVKPLYNKAGRLVGAERVRK